MVVRLRSNRLGVVLDNGRRASRPKVLAFKSEFEMLHGANPIAEAGVVVCQDALKLQQQLQEIINLLNQVHGRG